MLRLSLLLLILGTLVFAAHQAKPRIQQPRHPKIRDSHRSQLEGRYSPIGRRDESGASQGQWLVFVHVERPTSPIQSPTPTAINHANKGVVKEETAVKADQRGAQSYAQAETTQAKSTPIPPADQGSQGPVSQKDVQEWLKVHNEARRKHGAGALKWSNDLAVGAKSNAIQCRGEHTAEKGENIASNSKEMSPQIAVNQWMGHASLYNGQWQESTAHYTQMVWKSTQNVGCYLQECAPGTRYDAKYGTSWQATCRYDPAGNNLSGNAFANNTQG